MLFIQQLSTWHELVLAYFGNVHGLANFDCYGPLVWAPSDSEAAMALSPQLIFGAFGSRGKLKADVGEVFVAGAGDTTQPLHRLKYTMPQELGINPRDLDEIDSIAIEGMKDGAFPGVVVTAANNAKVFSWKDIGQHEKRK